MFENSTIRIALLSSMYVCHVTHLHISLHIYTKALQKHVVHTYITCQLSTADFIFFNTQY